MTPPNWIVFSRRVTFPHRLWVLVLFVYVHLSQQPPPPRTLKDNNPVQRYLMPFVMFPFRQSDRIRLVAPKITTLLATRHLLLDASQLFPLSTGMYPHLNHAQLSALPICRMRHRISLKFAFILLLLLLLRQVLNSLKWPTVLPKSLIMKLSKGIVIIKALPLTGQPPVKPAIKPEISLALCRPHRVEAP